MPDKVHANTEHSAVTAAQQAEQMKFAHSLSHQCQDGTLVSHPSQCGKDKAVPEGFPNLTIG
jgi:hypothetical protein